MREITDEEIKIRLRLDNPWWESGAIPRDLDQMLPRDYLEPFVDLVDRSAVRRAVVLLGPRRVGKTVMIHHAVQRLLDKGIDPQLILYASLDTPIYDLTPESLFNIFGEIHGHELADQPLYVFFDEVQYLKDWERHLKSLVDSYRSVKFVVSGSAASALRRRSEESGAGRFTAFFLPPLTFAEYLRFIERDSLVVRDEKTKRQPFATPDIGALNEAFVSYINYGGYPETALVAEAQENPSRFIREDIIDKVLLRDLPSLYGISDVQELNRLFGMLAYNSGDEVSLEKLSQSSGVAKNTIRRYLDYLEAAFLIIRVRRVDRDGARFVRDVALKTYLTNPSMRTALYGPIGPDHPAFGDLVETAVFSQWLHSATLRDLRYARWRKGEIDIVCLGEPLSKPIWAVEVKWSDRFFDQPGELAPLRDFARRNGLLKPPRVTTVTKFGLREIDGFEILFTPASVYCYTVGWYALKDRADSVQLDLILE